MHYIGGTEKANALIEKYKKLNYVVDFYSDEYQSTVNDDAYEDLHCDAFLQYDKKYGAEYRGHMLMIYVGDENKELILELSELYDPLKKIFKLQTQFGDWTHKPDILIINLATKEILCAGLGRKNRLFSYELHKYLGIKTTNDISNRSDEKNSEGNLNQCSDNFYRLDYANAAKRITRLLEELGSHYFSHDSLPANSDVMVKLNSKDGLYYLVDDSDHEGMTLEEVKELKQNYEDYGECIRDCRIDLRWYFPKIEDWDMNTGDY